MKQLTIDKHALTLATLRNVYYSPPQLKLSRFSRNAIKKSNRYLSKQLKEKKRIYGVNTGFGKLANVMIPDEELHDLQRNLILSHCSGVGPPIPDAIVGLIMTLKIKCLARGYSGVRSVILDYLIKLFNAKLYPLIPSKGSVGASGDLAPLAHLAAILLSHGQLHQQDKVISAFKALHLINQPPLQLTPKEGLALINGTQVSLAYALGALFAFENCFLAALLAGSLSLIAFGGQTQPFDESIQLIRNQQGQITVAKIYRILLANYKGYADIDRTQDPYSYRCQPQVMGACFDQLHFVSDVLLREANAVSDNPLIFSDDDKIISAGNFHAEPVAFAADNLALAIAEVGNLSERRISALLDNHMSGLPEFLSPKPGLHSGLMNAQVTAAALVSENKSLAHPASVDSIPTSANQEDHVSMATYAARRLHEMVANTTTIIAIELLCACQALTFRTPQKLSKPLEFATWLVREHVEPLTADRILATDIEVLTNLVKNGHFNAAISTKFLPSAK